MKKSSPTDQNWNRRDFLRSLGLGGAAAGVVGAPIAARAGEPAPPPPATVADGSAKNVLVFVSDGMNIGTLSLTDLFLREFHGKPDPWIRLYKEHPELVSRGLMNMASADSPVTDSAAASTAWSSGRRVNNGSINFDPDGNRLPPLYESVKAAGKATALVTTATVSHATPAGFAATSRSRSSENQIAPQYRENGVDVVLGGGLQFFDPASRTDGIDLVARYRSDGYQVFKDRAELLAAAPAERALGVFFDDHLPYHIDWLHSGTLQEKVPTLAEMTRCAIAMLASRPEGFVMQIEAARVDHAGHINDLGAIIHDQIAFGEALEEGLRFAAGRNDTLVIITTDHGCGGPNLNGVGGGYRDTASHFDRTRAIRRSLTSIGERLARHQGGYDRASAELVETSLGIDLNNRMRGELLALLNGLPESDRGNATRTATQLAGFHNPLCGVGWNSHQHTGDLVEIAAVGPGSRSLPPFIEGTFLRPWILSACGIG